MIDPIKWLLYFPPVCDRPELKGRVRYLIFMDYNRALDETYVYYKVFILNILLNAVFLVPYFISFFFEKNLNLWFLTINYRTYAATDELIYSYPKYFFPVLAIVTAIYSITLFATRTDYFSKRRIIREHVATMHANPRVFPT